jgi:hypothetical protein
MPPKATLFEYFKALRWPLVYLNERPSERSGRCRCCDGIEFGLACTSGLHSDSLLPFYVLLDMAG